MKVKCVERVQDDRTGEWYLEGKEYEFNEEVGKRLIGTKYFEPVDNGTKRETKQDVDTKGTKSKKADKEEVKDNGNESSNKDTK